VDALLGNANLRAVAGMLAGVVLHHHHADGTDASRWAAAALPDAQSGDACAMPDRPVTITLDLRHLAGCFEHVF